LNFYRLLLWDCDDRSYSYYVEVSINQRDWITVCDRSRQPCQSWQSINFTSLPAVYIKIVGTQNTANDVIHNHLSSYFERNQYIIEFHDFMIIFQNGLGISLCPFRVPSSRGKHRRVAAYHRRRHAFVSDTSATSAAGFESAAGSGSSGSRSFVVRQRRARRRSSSPKVHCWSGSIVPGSTYRQTVIDYIDPPQLN